MLGSGATYFALRSASTSSLTSSVIFALGISILMVSPSLDQADGTAGSSLGADVADGAPRLCAGEAAVGDEGHGLIQLHTGQSGGGVEHLAHTGAALRALVADDHHVARDDLACVDGCNGGLPRC